MELMIVVVVIMFLAAVVAPLTINAVSSVKLRYAAVDFSGLVQGARMQGVRKNTFYPIVATTLTGGDVAYFVDKSKPPTGLFASGDPMVSIGNVVAFPGVGSGAPNEAALTGSLNFGLNPGLPVMDARGLPCLVTGPTTCPETAGLGFITFFSNQGASGHTNWASVVVTPSGRVQVWVYDGANWIQR